MGKHAYLIMAHNQPILLKKLLCALDNNRVDIFLHIDKKSNLYIEDFKNILTKSQLFFVNRKSVSWGGFSQIDITLDLLELATRNDKYDYIHFISGVDIPLKKQEEILEFFDKYQGEEFISCKPSDRSDRIQYYYFFQNMKQSSLIKVLNRLSLAIQKRLHVDRLKKNNLDIGLGSAWFDITDQCAQYVLTKRKLIRKMFNYGNCADEMFIQTIVLNSPFRTKIHRHFSNKNGDKKLEQIYLNVLRHIVFNGAHPTLKTMSDKENLIVTDCLFARKFDYDQYPEIVDFLYETVHGQRNKYFGKIVLKE